MPELPEVESVRRGLVAAKLAAPVRSLWRSEFKLRIGKHWASENLECLQGAMPGEVGRRGKYIVWQFRGADEAALGLVIHLGMSGRCGVAMSSQPRVLHTHLALEFADGRELRLVDPRRFGGLRAGPWDAIMAGPPIGELGPEPLEAGFSGEVLAARLGSSARPIRGTASLGVVVVNPTTVKPAESPAEPLTEPAARAPVRSTQARMPAIQLRTAQSVSPQQVLAALPESGMMEDWQLAQELGLPLDSLEKILVSLEEDERIRLMAMGDGQRMVVRID